MHWKVSFLPFPWSPDAYLLSDVHIGHCHSAGCKYWVIHQVTRVVHHKTAEEINVNVYVYSLIYQPSVQQTSQFTPLVLELSLMQSHLLWVEFSICTFWYSYHYHSAFSFHQVPITAGWTETAWYERLAQHLYAWPWPAARPEHESPIQVLTRLNVAYLQWYDGNWLPLSHVLPKQNTMQGDCLLESFFVHVHILFEVVNLDLVINSHM